MATTAYPVQYPDKSKRKPPKADEIPTHPLQQGIHGVSMQRFLKLLDSDISATDIVEVKVFACSLESHTVFHFSTASRVFIESFNNDDAVHGSNEVFKAEYAAAPFDLYLRPRITNPCEAIQQPESAWQISI